MIAERLTQLAQATDGAIALLQRGQRAETVGQPVLERLANAARCEWGAYWTHPSSQGLQTAASWGSLGPKGERFVQDARVRTLAPNEGNAGHVWRTRKPIWTTGVIELLARVFPDKSADTLAAVERIGFRLGCAVEGLRPLDFTDIH